jgi:hypothetical protein
MKRKNDTLENIIHSRLQIFHNVADIILDIFCHDNNIMVRRMAMLMWAWEKLEPCQPGHMPEFGPVNFFFELKKKIRVSENKNTRLRFWAVLSLSLSLSRVSALHRISLFQIRRRRRHNSQNQSLK